MEVYRYWTRSKLEEAHKNGAIHSYQPSFRFPKHIFVLPNNPLLWGQERTNYIAEHIRNNHRGRDDDGLVLFKFEVFQTDPDINDFPAPFGAGG